MYEQHFSPQELETLHAHAHRASLFAPYLTPAELEIVTCRMAAHAADWPGLIHRLRQLRDSGHAFYDEPVQALALEWETLFRASYCGDDAALEAKVHAALRQEPGLMQGIGIDPPFIAYVQQAIMYRQRRALEKRL